LFDKHVQRHLKFQKGAKLAGIQDFLEDGNQGMEPI
jgi:hypothetical protein